MCYLTGTLTLRSLTLVWSSLTKRRTPTLAPELLEQLLGCCPESIPENGSNKVSLQSQVWKVLSEIPGCSYVWRSIAAACTVLDHGSKWRVGNGANISVCKDRWLPDQGDVFHILKYPLISSLPADTLIWWGTPNGKFSVKSAYHTAFLRLQRCLGAGSSDAVNMNQFWKSIWALNLPRKIINFVWRLCLNILPTRDNLVKHCIYTPLECPICGVMAETPIHIYTKCIFAEKVWEGSALGMDLHVDSNCGILDWVWGIWKHKGDGYFLKVVVVLWSVWNVRNSAIFRDMVKLPHNVYKDAIHFIKEYNDVHLKTGFLIPSVSRERVRWLAPKDGWYKVNMDGVVFADIQKVGVGAVIRNERGEFLGAMCELMEFGLDATDAEALAALRAIEFVVDICPFNLVFEGDCVQVIKALMTNEFDFSRVGHVYSIARSKLSLAQGSSVIHVPREGNSVAHCLAQFARNIVGSQVWLDSVPPFLQHCLSADVPVQFH